MLSVVQPLTHPVTKSLITEVAFGGYLNNAAAQNADQILGLTQSPGLDGKIVSEQPNKGTARTKQPGRYFEFDGTDDIVIADSAITLSGGFSIAFWINPDAHSAAFFDARTAIDSGVAVGTNGSGTVFLRINSSHTTTLTLSTGVWQHVAATYDGSTAKIYVDGIEWLSSSVTEDVSVSDAVAPYIGRAAYASLAPYNGSMADLRVKTGTVLTLSEIRELVTEGTDALANVDFALHYKMDDTHPTIAYDSNGNGNDGTKTNIDPDTFHAEGSDAPFSFQNDKGYTPYLHFDGTDDDIPLPTAGVVEDAAGAVSAWVVFDDFNGSASVILDIGGTGVNGLTFWSENNNAFKVFYGTGSVNTQLANFTADGATPHTLHHVLVRWSGSDIEAFLDGVSTDTASNFDSAIASYALKHIGSNAGSTRHAKGSVKDFWTFSNQLSDDDIAAIYAAGPGGSPSLAGSELFRMPLDDSSTKYWDTVSGTDHTPSSNTPTLIRAGRDESDKTKDVYGGTLAYSGECPSNAQMIDGGCGHMDGTDDYVAVADHADFDITNNLSGFIRLKNDGSGLGSEEYIFGKYDFGNNRREWLLTIDASEKVNVYLGDPADGTYEAAITSDSAITTDEDQSLGFTYDGTEIVLYRNGVVLPSSVTVGAVPASLYNSDVPVALGAAFNSGTAGNFWDGTLYDARIFSGTSAPLTAAQMLQLHNNEAESFSGQTNVLWLPMAEGGGDTHYCVVSSKQGTINSADTSPGGTYWSTKQPNFHYNTAKGCSKRENILPDASDLAGWSNSGSALTFTQSNDPWGNANALRIIPSDTTEQQYRIFTASTAADGEYIVCYAKLVGAAADSHAHPNLSMRFTGGGTYGYDFATGDDQANATMSRHSLRDIGDGWIRVAVPIDSGSGGTLQITCRPADNDQTDAVFTPSNTTDGMDIFVGVVTDPETDPYPTTVASGAKTVRNVPALADLSGDAVVPGHIQHAAGINRADYKVDWTGGVAYPTKNHAVRDNIFTDTENFSSSSWTHYSQVVTASAVEAPDGTFTGTRVGTLHQTDPDLGLKQAESSLVTGGNTYTFSVYVKGEGDEVGNSIRIYGKRSTTGTIVSESLDYVLTDSWERVEASITLNSDNIDVVWSISGSAESGTKASECLVWGAKCEEWHEATPYIDSDRSSENVPTDWELPIEMLSNTRFSGAVAGTPGTAPTDWAFGASGGTTAISGEELTFTTSAARQYIYQTVSLKANSIYELTISAESVSGDVDIQEILGYSSAPSGLTADYFLDGVGDSGTTHLSGTQTVKMVMRTAATAGTIILRVGLGTGSNTTGSITLSAPTFKRNYINPLFHRELTKNGILHRADRLTKLNQVAVGDALTAMEDFTETIEVSS